MRYIFLASPLKALDFSKVKIHRTLRSSEKANKNRTHKMGTKGQISILCRFLSSSTETLIRTSILWWSAKKEKHMFPEAECKPRNAISSELIRNENIYIKLLILKNPNQSDNIFKHDILCV